jgi:hypothetical protein
MRNLANANFRNMEIRSGAGDYTLDFSGDLRQDAQVDIESAVSQFTIIVPEGTSARVEVEGGLSNVDVEDDWDRQGQEYIMQGEGPEITIHVTMSAGNLVLRND